MTRVLSGAILILVAVGVVWFAPPPLFVLVAELLLVLGFTEYLAIARAGRFRVPAVPACAAAMLTCAAFARRAYDGRALPLDVVLAAAIVALGVLTLGQWSGGVAGKAGDDHSGDGLGIAAASVFPALYLGLPLGTMIAIREIRGREALLLLMLTVIVSDTAQYYSGRAFGRRLLAPAISPKKTVEGAIGGFIFGGLTLAVAGAWWLPAVPGALRALLGAAIVAFGIAGDLFESMLKRSVGVKDSSALIPGHGGVLDRVDALLFAAPVYYVALRVFDTVLS